MVYGLRLAKFCTILFEKCFSCCCPFSFGLTPAHQRSGGCKESRIDFSETFFAYSPQSISNLAGSKKKCTNHFDFSFYNRQISKMRRQRHVSDSTLASDVLNVSIVLMRSCLTLLITLWTVVASAFLLAERQRSVVRIISLNFNFCRTWFCSNVA